MKWLATLVLLFLVIAPPAAQSQAQELRVATRVVRPFVFEEGGNLTGFSVDLWQEVAIQLGVRTQWDVRGSVRDLLDATQRNEADLAIAAISITEERERGWDFSQPMFDAGLQILIPQQEGGGGGLATIIGAIVNPDAIPVVLLVLVVVVLMTHIVWFFERHNREGMISSPRYYPGIFEAFFWACSTLATQADSMPKSAAARVTAVVWMFSAVLFIAFFTAAVTSSLTVSQLKGDINGPDDLPGKRVATVRGSTSAQYLTSRNIGPTEFDTVDQATEVLLKGDADAVVYDAPVLQYFASHEGKGKAATVGPVFRKESYGILFPQNSQHRKPVNEALLRLRENGTYDRLQTKWFGGEAGAKTS